MKLLTRAALAVATSLSLAAAVAPAASAAPSGITGIDVASHQHTSAPVNWVAASGPHNFAFVKASEGDGYVNPHYVADANVARVTGLHVGAYHYARPSLEPGDAAREAGYYLAAQSTAPGPKLPPVLDIEESGGLSVTQLQNWVRDFVKAVDTATGRQTMIYTYPAFWASAMGNTSEFSDHPLWIADYNGGSQPWVPGGWDTWTFWQTSGTGASAGVTGPVDTNVFNGSHARLSRLVS